MFIYIGGGAALLLLLILGLLLLLEVEVVGGDWGGCSTNCKMLGLPLAFSTCFPILENIFFDSKKL